MSRTSRLKGENAFYHVMQRGNAKKEIFRDSRDKERYLQALKMQQHKYGFELYSYCLMDNHIHLLLGAAGADISDVMKGLNVSYVQYFNKKHACCGHLFQGRFKSEIVDTDSYLLQASKYIHLNPVTAKIVNNPIDYSWSSYGIYMGQLHDEYRLLNTALILSIATLDTNSAVSAYQSFVESGLPGNEDYERPAYIRFEKMERLVKKEGLEMTAEILARQGSRDDIIFALNMEAGLSCREISQCMGSISPATVHRILQKASLENKLG